MSTSNPYDPTGFSTAVPPPLPPAGIVGPLPPYSFAEAFERGWRVFKNNYGVLLGASAVLIVLSVVDSLVQDGLRGINPLLPLMWTVPFALLVSMPLSIAIMLVGARAARGGKAVFTDLFLGYRRLGWVILWALLVYLVIFALIIPPALVAGIAFAAGGQTVGALVTIPLLLVFVALMLILGVRFAFVPAMLVDPEMPRLEVFEAARTSWRLTAPVWGSLLGLFIVAGLLVVSSLLLLCVGIVFVGYPLLMGVLGSAYALVVNPYLRPGQRCHACGYSSAGRAPGTACPECGAVPGLPATPA